LLDARARTRGQLFEQLSCGGHAAFKRFVKRPLKLKALFFSQNDLFTPLIKCSSFFLVLPAFVRTYVQRGSKFCFVVFVVVVVLVLVLVLADTLLRILNYSPISPCFQHITPLHAPLPGSLAR
jgi:hypothetical protein